MATQSFKIKKSLNLEPQAAPSLTEQGDVAYNSSTDKVQVRASASTRTLTDTDSAQTLTNKSIDADQNTITNIDNADIKAGAAIDRSKIAAGTANHALINDGSGNLSSEAQLDETRGGTGIGTYTTGDMLYASGANTLSKLAVGSSGQVLQVSAGIPAWGSVSSTSTVVSKTANYTATASDDIILCNATSGGASFAITLPTAVGISGKKYTIKRVVGDTDGTKLVSLNTTSAQTIDGAASGAVYLYAPGDEIVVVSDGSNWVVLDRILPRLCGLIRLGSNQSINSASTTTVLLDTSVLSDYSMVNTASNRIDIKYSGVYAIYCNLSCQTNAANERDIFITKNGSNIIQTTQQASATNSTDMASSTILNCAAGDYIKLDAYQNSGGALNVLSGTFTNLRVVRIANYDVV